MFCEIQKSICSTQILNHQPVQRQQIDVGITVDVLIHFHCIFGTDRKKSRINFCTTGELLRVILFSIQSPEDFVPIREIITITFFQACLLSCEACTLWVRNFQHLITFLWCFFWWWSYMGFYPLLLGKTWLSEWISQSNNWSFHLLFWVKLRFMLWLGNFISCFFHKFFPAQNFSRPQVQPVNNLGWLIGKRVKG